MADTKDYYFQNCNTLIPWASTPSGGTSKGASIIILSDSTLGAATMMASVEGVITDFYSNTLGGTASDMTHWATGALMTGCIDTATASAFNPYLSSAGAQNDWITTLNGGALNFNFGSTGIPTGPGTGGVSATAISQHLAIVKVKNSSGIIDNTKLAIITTAPGFRISNTAYYRGATKAAVRFTNTATPATVTVTAYPSLIVNNCVTNTTELILPGSPTTVGSC